MVCSLFLLLCVASTASGFQVNKRHHVQQQNALARIESRNAWLEASFSNERDAANRATLHSPLTVSLLAPYYSCPYTLSRSNLVSEYFEGGKWTCGIRETRQSSCVVYSFGSDGNDIFEKGVLQANPNCEIHVFDPTSKPVSDYNFHEYGLCAKGDSFQAGGKTYPCKSLEAIFKELNHPYVTILKMDVEGGEWDVFRDVSWGKLNVGQILVEFHDQRGERSLHTLIHDYFEKLENAGFYMFTLEPVCAGCPGQFEFGFLQVDWLPYANSNTNTFDTLVALPGHGKKSSAFVILLIETQSANGNETQELQRYTNAFHIFMRSLRLTGNTERVVALVSNDTPASWIELTKIYQVETRHVPILKSTGVSPHYERMLTKLHIWNMTEFDRIAYFDVDRIFMHDPSSLFDLCKTNFCAVQDHGITNRKYFNAGFFVTTPSLETFKMLYALREKANNRGLAEQDMLNDVFSDWTALPAEYNLMPKGFIPTIRTSLQNAISIHEKYWQLYDGGGDHLPPLQENEWPWNFLLNETYG